MFVHALLTYLKRSRRSGQCTVSALVSPFPQFPIFCCAVVTTSLYCDEDSHVVFVHLRLSKFITQRIEESCSAMLITVVYSSTVL